MCPNNCIKDENHFVTECLAYQELRTPFIRLANIESLPVNLQFMQLMRNKSGPLIYALAKISERGIKITKLKQPLQILLPPDVSVSVCSAFFNFC